MSPRNSKLSAASILGYSLPVIHDTTKSKIYVDFYAIDPATNEKRRKKMFVSAPTKREAKKRAQELASTITAKLREGWNPWVNESNGRNYALITDVLDRYQDYVERMDRRKTVLSYLSRLNILRKFIESRPLPLKYVFQLDKAFFNDFLDYIHIDKGRSGRTRNNYRGWCVSFCQFLVDRNFMETNPCSSIKSVREEEKKRQPLTPDMIRTMAAEIRESDPHFLLACLIEYFMFIRPSELVGLKIGDISESESYIFISGQISKNRTDGKVAMNHIIRKLMEDLHIFNLPSNWYLFGKSMLPGPKKAGPDIFNHRWTKFRKKMGWSDEYKFYSLKDSGIKDMANSRGIVVARDQARHSDISITNKYLKGRDRLIIREALDFTGALDQSSR